MATATITHDNITAGTIIADDIANATITGAKIASGTIAALNITNATITTTQISGTAGITGGQLANNTITATQIANATITTTQISGTAAITGSQIANATITADNIANTTITAAKIANATITATQIANLTITATQIDNLTITGGKIAGGAITYDKISVANLAAINADLGAITAGNITLDASGFIKGGQTAFNTGVGFWLGYDTSVYKFSIGNPAGNRLIWNGTNLVIEGGMMGNSKCYIISDDIYWSDDTDNNTGQQVWTEVKSVNLPSDFPTQNVRISFHLRATTVQETIYGRIYKNDVAYGTERSNNVVNGETYTEDLEFSTGDQISIYAKAGPSGSNSTVSNFRILGSQYPGKYTLS